MKYLVVFLFGLWSMESMGSIFPTNAAIEVITYYPESTHDSERISPEELKLVNRLQQEDNEKLRYSVLSHDNNPKIAVLTKIDSYRGTPRTLIKSFRILDQRLLEKVKNSTQESLMGIIDEIFSNIEQNVVPLFETEHAVMEDEAITEFKESLKKNLAHF